jgi:hypothetical protein
MPGVPRAMMAGFTSWPRDLAHVHVQDLLAASDVGQRHIHLAVKAPWAQQGGVQNVGAVGGGHHDHAQVGLEAVHLDQHLVQRLLALVVATAQACATLAAHGVDFVDEDDAGSVLLGVLEHVAYAGRAHADEHFHEVGTRDAEERHLGLARNGLGQQRLAGARRADQQQTARNAPAQLLKLAGSFRKSTTSLTSSLASSQPATSAKVMVLLFSSSMRALLLPKLKAPPLPPPCIWRMKYTHTPISSSMGPQLTSRVMSSEPSSRGLTSNLTLLLIRSPTKPRSR